MFSKNSIEKRVMRVIKSRIASAQKKFDDGCGKIDAKAEVDKTILADELVASLISTTTLNA